MTIFHKCLLFFSSFSIFFSFDSFGTSFKEDSIEQRVAQVLTFPIATLKSRNKRGGRSSGDRQARNLSEAISKALEIKGVTFNVPLIRSANRKLIEYEKKWGIEVGTFSEKINHELESQVSAAPDGVDNFSDDDPTAFEEDQGESAYGFDFSLLAPLTLELQNVIMSEERRAEKLRIFYNAKALNDFLNSLDEHFSPDAWEVPATRRVSLIQARQTLKAYRAQNPSDLQVCLDTLYFMAKQRAEQEIIPSLSQEEEAEVFNGLSHSYKLKNLQWLVSMLQTGSFFSVSPVHIHMVERIYRAFIEELNAEKAYELLDFNHEDQVEGISNTGKLSFSSLITSKHWWKKIPVALIQETLLLTNIF